MQVNGQTLASTGITNDDGTVSGATLISAPAGVNVPLVTTATQLYGANYFTFTNQVYQLVSQCVATTPANQSRTNLGVGEQVNLSFYPTILTPYTNINWTATAGGQEILWSDAILSFWA